MIPSTKALGIDRDTQTRAVLAELVQHEGFTVTLAASPRDGAGKDQDRNGHRDRLVTKPEGWPSDVVFRVGKDSISTVLAALRERAYDCFAKGSRQPLTKLAFESEKRIGSALTDAQTTGLYGQLRGRSAPMLDLYRNIDRVAPTDATVLLSGETGSGKEVVARTLHDNSRCRTGEFVALNCGAVSPSLVESELFGHESGSFTGAIRKHDGVFARAHKGTLFLDEITEMPLDLQVKLLRVLETNSFHRLGGEKAIFSDARIIAATNRSPEAAVREGKLREDLYYRLRVFPIEIPPLRERGSDIGLLAQHFLDELNSGAETNKRFSQKALTRMQNHPWPGNVRELKHFVHQAFLMADRCLEADTLADTPDEVPGSADRIDIAVGSSIAEAEKRLIQATMERFGGDKAKVAKILGISLKTLYIRLNLYLAEESA